MHNGQASMPSRYPGVVAIIEEIGWTWQDINNAPADLVDELLTRIYSRRKWEHERHRMDESMRKQKAAKKK